MCKSQSFVTILDFIHTRSQNVQAKNQKNPYITYVLCIHKSAYNAYSISLLLIINKQEMHSISRIASFTAAAAALCKQDSHQLLCSVHAHFVRFQSFDLSMFLSNYTNSECVCVRFCVQVCACVIRNSMTFVEQRHRLLFNFKVA